MSNGEPIKMRKVDFFFIFDEFPRNLKRKLAKDESSFVKPWKSKELETESVGNSKESSKKNLEIYSVIKKICVPNMEKPNQKKKK